MATKELRSKQQAYEFAARKEAATCVLLAACLVGTLWGLFYLPAFGVLFFIGYLATVSQFFAMSHDGYNRRFWDRVLQRYRENPYPWQAHDIESIVPEEGFDEH